MISVPKIEMHLAYACNLRCESCNHYSDYGFAGLVSLAEGGRWLRGWGERIQPLRLSFLGGEPLLNPELPEFLATARDLWPRARIRLVSNGLLIERWGERLWSELGAAQATLTVSIHSRDRRYIARLQPLLDHARAEARRHGFTFEARNSVDGWYRSYRGRGSTMQPYTDGDPRASWRACSCRHCVTLEDNQLWKCPPLAHLPRVAAKFGLDASGGWAIPLAYRPLTREASDDEIRAFFARGPEPACGMCPSRPDHFEKSIFGHS